MNYCYACRRHLNGAFSCPGCGAIADRSAMPDEADTAQLPPVTDAADDGDADLPPPAAPLTPLTPTEGSLVDDLLRDSGLGPDAGPGLDAEHRPEPRTDSGSVAPEAEAEAVPYGADAGSVTDTGSGVYAGGDHDSGNDGQPGEDRLGDAALAESLFGVGGGGGYREDPDSSRAARRRRGRHQRAAILGVGAVAVVGSLTMFGVAAFSGGSSGSSTEPGPGITAVSSSPDTGLPSPGGTGDESPGAPPSSGATSGSASPSGSGTSGSPSTHASHTSGSGGSASSAPGKPSHTASASPSRTTGAPPSTKPPTSSPATPSPTCTHVLWWCQ